MYGMRRNGPIYQQMPPQDQRFGPGFYGISPLASGLIGAGLGYLGGELFDGPGFGGYGPGYGAGYGPGFGGYGPGYGAGYGPGYYGGPGYGPGYNKGFGNPGYGDFGNKPGFF
ncbi:hypothetical protein GCM10011351_07030 [Paraliobacillus quinghaiensis]|uniref:Spore coat protein n=1 Tax=Paraliobacillus quinghaiensis TaxID=470815 RepID=A0A917TIH5_9BACI|nr:hypothetical protein [Paraliobacillus quinghaiensis]GGM23824.1 hypothetical protein GCM10011351_07030 [Paraliobacillus quinghaiensis]